MNTVHRRTEIINILIIRRHTTANELAQEFGVSIRTIQYDIQALTPVYPIYTKQGENGGIFIREDYKPYANSLTPMEVAALHELYDWTEGIHKKVLFQVLRKYGPDNFYRTVHSRRKCAYVLFRLTISALILSKMQTMSAIVP